MKRIVTYLIALFLLSTQEGHAQTFSRHFCDSTLRLDYIFAGDTARQHIFVDELSMTPRWYGRKHRLAELPLKGNGQLTVTDPQTGDTLYRHSFSTLFQEWLATDEAKHTARAFENVFLMPYPRHAVDVMVELYDYHDRVMAQLRHQVDPRDILIRRPKEHTPFKTLQQAADTTRCIHIAYVAEGYTEEQMPQFLADCQTAMESMFQHEPFTSMRDRFNIVAVLSPSKDTDVSQPGEGVWRNTALASHFDTFYSRRYLTTLHLKLLHDVLSAVPYEHIIILANTSHYGGGGIYNSYNLSYTRGKHFRPVVVHEFGHSFGGLGDEYPYGDADPMYFSDTEPWEPNLTTHPEQPKWQDLIDARQAGVVEGGGYLSKGVWRSQKDCRMRTNEHPEFCPVCQQALRRLIDFYTR
ncbi:MAG: peptidase M64 [Prevotella sp.]|nr:peptidase M64 [Prevotella sp.]